MTSPTAARLPETRGEVAEAGFLQTWLAAAGGQQWAWERIVADWAPTVYALAAERLPADLSPAAVCEVVWPRLADRLGSWCPTEPAALRGWLVQVVAEEAARLVALRDHTARRLREQEPAPGDGEDPASLVAAAGRGEQGAWDSLVKRYAGLIWAITRNFRLGADDAADVSQTTWLRLVENLDRLTEPASVGAWLATTARRECIRLVGRARKQVLVGDDAMLDVIDLRQPDVDTALLSGETAEEVRRAFERCPPRCQVLLRLLMLDPPPSYEEISAALGVPIGSIGPTRGRCLAKLRVLLEQLQGAQPVSVR